MFDFMILLRDVTTVVENRFAGGMIGVLFYILRFCYSHFAYLHTYKGFRWQYDIIDFILKLYRAVQYYCSSKMYFKISEQEK